LPDGGLTDIGEAQAQALRFAFAEMNPHLVLVSPSRRARETAAAAGLSGTSMADLAEWEYGPYTEALAAGRPEADDPMWIWQQASRNQPNQPETLATVSRRVERVIDALTPFKSDAKPIVLVSHGHLLRLLAVRWLGLPPLTAAQLHLRPAGIGYLIGDRSCMGLDAWNARPERLQELAYQQRLHDAQMATMARRRRAPQRWVS
jgi:probable phosphoglycerate mutase